MSQGWRTKEVERNATQFIIDYQRRHQKIVMQAYEWRGFDGLCDMSRSYWKWRSAWLEECLRHCPDWRKDQPALQVSTIGYVAIGEDNVKFAHPILRL